MIFLSSISLRKADKSFLPTRAFKRGPCLEDRVAILRYYCNKTGWVFVNPKIVTKFTKRVVSIEQSRHSTSFCNRTRTVSISVFFFYSLHSRYEILIKVCWQMFLYLQGPLQTGPCREDRVDRLKPYCNRTGGVFWYHFFEVSFSYETQTKIYTNTGLKLKKKCPENRVGF